SKTKVTLGVVPTGTGNALAVSLGYTDLIDAAFRITKGVQRPLKVLQVTVDPAAEGGGGAARTMYSFCVVSWGLHCNNVSSSESLRFLGSFRFLLAAMKNVLLLRQYMGTLKLWGAQRYEPAPTPADTYSLKPVTENLDAGGWLTLEGG